MKTNTMTIRITQCEVLCHPVHIWIKLWCLCHYFLHLCRQGIGSIAGNYKGRVLHRGSVQRGAQLFSLAGRRLHLLCPPILGSRGQMG